MRTVDTLAQRVVLITGAASGIGRETAIAFAQTGAALELLDLDADGLAHTALLCGTAGATVHAHTVDVSVPERMAEVAEQVHARVPAVDVLINNAGVGVVGSFVGTDLATWRWAIDVNVLGVVHGCHYFVPKMIEHRSATSERTGGHVLNVASAAGYSAAKLLPVYTATKYAVVGMSDALRGELRPHGICVTTVCPGVIDTPITRNMRATGHLAKKAGVHDRAAALYQKRNYSPTRVAKAMLKAVQTRQNGILPVSPEAWLLYYGARLAPRAVAAMLSRDVV